MVSKNKIGEDNMSEKVFTQDWFSANIPCWDSIIRENFANKENLNFLEIGSFEGRSACWLMEEVLTHESSCLTCIDPFTKSVENASTDLRNLRQRFDHNTKEWHNKMRVIQKQSGAALPELLVAHEKFDVIYIDGSHMACDVMFDAVNCFELLKLGGIMVFDDYLGGKLTTIADVKPAVDAFIFSYQHKINVFNVAYQLWLQKTSD